MVTGTMLIMATYLFLATLLSCLLSTSSLSLKSPKPSTIKHDERVILFPTIASRRVPSPSLFNQKLKSKQQQQEKESKEGWWEVPIHGWIFQPEETSLKRRAFISLLRSALDIKKEEEESFILKRRVKPFLVDNKRGKMLKVRLGNDNTEEVGQGCLYHVLPRSKKNGHFKGMVKLSDEEMYHVLGLSSSLGEQNECNDYLAEINNQQHLQLQISMTARPKDNRTFTSTAHILPPPPPQNDGDKSHHISIISDIDDTIKQSNVLQKDLLIRNTFLKEFQSVPSMVSLYNHWSDTYNINCFHYVSSSPWQLYEELRSFMSRDKFPIEKTLFHLKTIRLKDRSLLSLLEDPKQSKIDSIESIIQQYYPHPPPKEDDCDTHYKFILVGDTGEKDPEVYGEIMRRHPNLILAAFLRNVTHEKKENHRLSIAFAGVGCEKWELFHESEDGEAVLEKMKDLKYWQ